MRKILFRAKQKDKGNWVEGYYIRQDETTYCFKEDYERHPENTKHYIVFDMPTDWGLPNRHLMAEIVPETLCQYTGLTDKNGKRIWENDIVDTPYRRFVVTYSDGVWGGRDGVAMRESIFGEGGTVVGNIFDNPELLKGE